MPLSSPDAEAAARIAEAAKLLAAARVNARPLATLPAECRPRDVAEALAVQDAVLDELGEPIGAWKVGAISYEHPTTSSPILASTVLQSPAHFTSGQVRIFGVEAELAFRFKHDLVRRATPYTRDEVLDAIDVMYPVIEVLESRFVDILRIDRASAVADFISNGYLVVGPPVENWRSMQLVRPLITITRNGRLFVLSIGNNGGEPIRMLVDLVNHACERKGALKADALVTTGTCTGIVFADPGDEIVASFKGMGEVRITSER